MRRFTPILIAILFLVGRMSVSMAVDHEQAIPNAFCPVTQDEEIDPDIHVEYDGEKVFFCCNRCRKKFLDDPTAYLDALPQFTAHSDQEDDHDHAADHGPAESKTVLNFIGKFHPLVVHFPIALLLVALLAEGLTLWRGDGFFRDAARFAVSLGAAGALAAAPLGWLAARGAGYPDDLMRILFYHRWLGVSVATISVGAALLSHLLKKHPNLLTAYRVCLLLSAVLVGITGHLGATLIYGTDYFTW